jgi:hypothetical protein
LKFNRLWLDVYLPMDIDMQHMANIRLTIFTRRLRPSPFEFVKINHAWFIDRILNQDLSCYFTRGDRLLVSNNDLSRSFDMYVRIV